MRKARDISDNACDIRLRRAIYPPAADVRLPLDGKLKNYII